MKIRLIALFLLLAVALTGCTPALRPAEPETTRLPAPTEATEAVETEKPTEAQTEATETATEATEASTELTEALGVDLGTVDERTYTNETLGISASFPEGWYIYTESDIADLNNIISNMYDNAAVYNAIEEGQWVIFFCASHLSSMASVNIGAMKNYYSYLDEKTYVEVAVPQTRVQLEQLGGAINKYVIHISYPIIFSSNNSLIILSTSASLAVRVLLSLAWKTMFFTAFTLVGEPARPH